MSLPVFPAEKKPRGEPIAWELSVVFASMMLGNNLFTKISLLLCLFYFTYANWQALPEIVMALRHAGALLAFQAWAVVSVMWSVVPSVTLDVVATQCAFFCLCILMARHAMHKNMGRSLKLAAFLVITVIVLFTVLFPAAAVSPGGFKAFYGNKNNLGIILAICIMTIIYTGSPKWLDFGMAGVAFVFLVLSQSKTSLIVTGAVALIFLLVIAYRALSGRMDDFSKGILHLTGTCIYAVSHIAIIAGVFYREEIANFLIEAIPYEFLTGRGELWVTVLKRTSQDLLRGLGPGSFWSAGPLSEIAQTSLFTKHPGWIENLGAADGGYVDTIGSLGFIGLALLLLSMVSNYRRIARLGSNATAILPLMLITFFALHNFTETTIYLSTNPIWFLYMLSSFYLIFIVTAKPTPARETPGHEQLDASPMHPHRGWSAY